LYYKIVLPKKRDQWHKDNSPNQSSQQEEKKMEKDMTRNELKQPLSDTAVELSSLAKTTPMDYTMPMNTVVELPEFIRRADKLLLFGKSEKENISKAERNMRQFRWNQEKNLKLSEERGISFETIVYAIRKGDVIDVIDHPNPEKYPNQWVYAVNINDYVYLVPFVREENGVHFLKTIIPSRRATRQYLRRHEE
jgi:uncharacterized DUF497 family protein